MGLLGAAASKEQSLAFNKMKVVSNSSTLLMEVTLLATLNKVLTSHLWLFEFVGGLPGCGLLNKV